MVTDHRPFLGGSEMSILEMVRECRVAAPSTLNPRIPEKLENVIMMALAREPDDRYQDAAEMHRDLERVLHEWQPPQAGGLARFLEVLFDEEERSDALDEPEGAGEGLVLAADADLAAVAAEPEPAGAVVDNDELDLTPPPGPPEPEPPAPRAPESLSQKLLKRFGIK
jgi:serine/threonine protein kinase